MNCTHSFCFHNKLLGPIWFLEIFVAAPMCSRPPDLPTYPKHLRNGLNT